MRKSFQKSFAAAIMKVIFALLALGLIAVQALPCDNATKGVVNAGVEDAVNAAGEAGKCLKDAESAVPAGVEKAAKPALARPASLLDVGLGVKADVLKKGKKGGSLLDLDVDADVSLLKGGLGGVLGSVANLLGGGKKGGSLVNVGADVAASVLSTGKNAGGKPSNKCN